MTAIVFMLMIVNCVIAFFLVIGFFVIVYRVGKIRDHADYIKRAIEAFAHRNPAWFS